MAVAQYSKLTVEGLRKLLPPGFYPSWVVFTRRQKVTSFTWARLMQYQNFLLIWMHFLPTAEVAKL